MTIHIMVWERVLLSGMFWLRRRLEAVRVLPNITLWAPLRQDDLIIESQDMAAKHEYKQRCDNPAILSAMKGSSCELSTQQDPMRLSIICLFQEYHSRLTRLSHLNTTGSFIMSAQLCRWQQTFLCCLLCFQVSDVQSCHASVSPVNSASIGAMMSHNTCRFCWNICQQLLWRCCFPSVAETGRGGEGRVCYGGGAF